MILQLNPVMLSGLLGFAPGRRPLKVPGAAVGTTMGARVPVKPVPWPGLTSGLDPVTPVPGTGVTSAPVKPGPLPGVTSMLEPVNPGPVLGVTKLGLQSGSRQQGSAGLARSTQAESRSP